MHKFILLPLFLFVAVLFVGCTGPADTQEAKSPSESKDGDHGHKAGTQGGLIFAIGRDNYHTEAVFDKDGSIRLYMLGKDEARLLEVDVQTLQAAAWPEGDNSQARAFDLSAEPQPGDNDGKTSRFVGKLPPELRGKRVVVTIPTIKIAGERFRFEVKNAGPDQHASMPKGVAAGSDKEKQLFLQPGGIYTAADINANGNTVPSVKFKEIEEWPHDDAMKVGDKICPVTENKADVRCSWVVNSQKYEFCCPPCLHKFVGWAKNEPSKIKDPSDYVHK